jgi:hypothetical protein
MGHILNYSFDITRQSEVYSSFLVKHFETELKKKFYSSLDISPLASDTTTYFWNTCHQSVTLCRIPEEKQCISITLNLLLGSATFESIISSDLSWFCPVPPAECQCLTFNNFATILCLNYFPISTNSTRYILTLSPLMHGCEKLALPNRIKKIIEAGKMLKEGCALYDYKERA